MELTLANIDSTIAELQKRRQQTAEAERERRQYEAWAALPTEGEVLEKMAREHGEPVTACEYGTTNIYYKDGTRLTRTTHTGWKMLPPSEEAPKRILDRLLWLKVWADFLGQDARGVYLAAVGDERGMRRRFVWTPQREARYGFPCPMSSPTMIDGLELMLQFKGVATRLRDYLKEIKADGDQVTFNGHLADVADQWRAAAVRQHDTIANIIQRVLSYPTK